MEESFFDCYQQENRLKFVSGLVIFGAEHFKEAYIIENLEKLSEIVHTENQHPDDIYPFVKNFLVDSIRIMLFFENFMKSVLIDNKFLVHKISDKEQYKDLKKAQYKRPISVKEFLEINENTINNGQKFSEGLTKKTITVSNLLKRDYFEPFEFSENIKESIIQYNTYRNELHLNHKISLPLNKKRVSNLKEIDKFVSDSVKKIIDLSK